MSLKEQFHKKRVEKLKTWLLEFYPEVEVEFKGYWEGNYSLHFKNLQEGGPDFITIPNKPNEYYLNNGRVNHAQIIFDKMKEIEKEIKHTFFIPYDEIEKWSNPEYDIINSIYNQMKRHEAQTNGVYKAKKLILLYEEYLLMEPNKAILKKQKECFSMPWFNPNSVAECLIYFGLDLEVVVLSPPGLLQRLFGVR